MNQESKPGYGACYLGEGRSVSAFPDWLMAETLRPSATESSWLTWGRSLFAVVVVLTLMALGIANMAMYSRWHDVEDGVLWGARAEGVTAIEVAPGSPAIAAGLQRGDVVLAVNGAPIETPADIIAIQHQARDGARLTYSVLRLAKRQAI